MKLRAKFFKKINKIYKTLARLIKKRRERTQINKIRNEKVEVTTNTTEIQRIMSDYYKQLYVSKMDSLEEMDKFLEMYTCPRLNQEEIENMNRPITSNEIVPAIKQKQKQKQTKILPANKSPRRDGFTGEFYQIFREELTPVLILF